MSGKTKQGVRQALQQIAVGHPCATAKECENPRYYGQIEGMSVAITVDL